MCIGLTSPMPPHTAPCLLIFEVEQYSQSQSAPARVDPPRLQQVFTNLLDNASKYGGDGEILVEVNRENGQAVVRVSDEG